MQLLHFVVRVHALCRKFDGSVSSWIRTAKRNQLVGGAPHSEHLSGFAMDVVWDDPPAIAVVQTEAADLGLKVIRESDHDHIQPFERS